MKTHLLCVLALGLAATATAAAAQDSDSITVQTQVQPYCANLGADPAPLALGELTGDNGFIAAAFAGDTSYSVSSYYCNAPATVTLAAAPLMRTPTIPVPDSASFTDRVDYVANLVWDDVTGSVNSAANTPSDIDTAEANTGALIVSVSDPSVAGSRRPIAGDYAGAVTLTVTLD